MRIIAKRTLKQFWDLHSIAEQPLKAWFDEAQAAEWRSPNELKVHYRTASIISRKRVVFNIHGNAFRLVVDIEYRLGILFVVWIGTHA
jgi:mRNA interferase HigB